MRRLVTAALPRGKMNVPTGYARLGRRVVDPKAVYGSQRGHARALYRRINGRPARPQKASEPPLTTGHVSTGEEGAFEHFDTAVGAADDRIREPVNWGLVVGLLGRLAVWRAVVLGLGFRRLAGRSGSARPPLGD